MNTHDFNTDELLKKLSDAALGDFFESEVPLPAFHDYITGMCRDQNETREHVIKRSGINRTYGHQLFNGTRKPSRDKVIQLAFGFGLDVAQTQQLLKAAQESPLYPRIKRDAAILYCIMHRLDFSKTQKLLGRFHLQTLGG